MTTNHFTAHSDVMSCDYQSLHSSPLVDPGRLKIVFNVEELPRRVWLKEERWGLATGWFSNVAVPQMTSGKLVQVRMWRDFIS